MRRLLVLTGMAALALANGAGAATLNKCIDARGKVTYSNLPCSNAREARTVEILPPPVPDSARPAPVQPQPVRRQQPKPAAQPPARLQLETRQTSGKPAPSPSARQCDALSNKLGRVFDKMDQARRRGYTQEQMDAWKREAQDLERRKHDSGCF